MRRIASSSLPIAWACGGGVQSAGIAALIINRKLPKPGFAYMVDAGWEKSRTWRYMFDHIVPGLATVGVIMHIIPSGPNSPIDTGGRVLIPAFKNDGKLKTRCSEGWKRRVAKRWLRKQGVKACLNWVGISIDEQQRVRESVGKWMKNTYPLLETNVSREDCIAAAMAVGWPEPKQSSCVFCPNHTDAGWADLKVNYPDDWKRAVEAERMIRHVDPSIFLHASRVPLDEAILASGVFCRKCLVCGVAFTTSYDKRLCCSTECMKENKRRWARMDYAKGKMNKGQLSLL